MNRLISVDEIGQAITVGLIVLVFVGVLLAANAGETHHTWRVIAYSGMTGIASLVAVLSLFVILNQLTAAGGGSRRLVLGSALAVLGALVSPVMMLPQVRVGLARVLKQFRPESSINAVSASLYVLVVTYFLSQQVSVDQLQAIKQSGQSPSLIFIIATNQLPFFIVSFAGVGLFVRRDPRGALQRLGLYWPGWRWIGVSMLVAVALVFFGIEFDNVMTKLTPDQSKAINDVSQQLLKDVSTPIAAIVLALAAGIGEEIIFRGAVQPRFGIIAASVLFAVMHTQYAVSLATLEIFILGIFLGILRNRAGVIASIIAHAGYDLILLMIPYALFYLQHK